MKISILDQSPISSGKTAEDALEASVKLAQFGEQYGYTRYWIAEHHDISGLACSAPEVMLGYIGARTNTIRIGSGAVLLPNYKPYKVAETHNLLATLFEGRIDIGIGRSPGGSAEASLALSDNFLQQMSKYPESVKELLRFINQDFPSDHLFSKITASPQPRESPQPWILGTSTKSALLAAECGTGYAYAHFMRNHGTSIVEGYRDNFRKNGKLARPNIIIAVSVICAETTEKAEKLALSQFLWAILSSKGEKMIKIPSIEETEQYTFSEKEEEMIHKMKRKMIIGNPREVNQQLHALQALYGADEMMILTITHQYEDRLRSYQLIAEELSKNK
ncbi:LLM class flavin-dependent oxidoreductase [Metabacillus sediminilitoris]|uniref:LLM class flavin-dependent oxidoreductase n=1 Tax=Metabacillus sediminilitoris TaxID=2567941 RepID=A0A4S4C000_9BACI|nr:LLM class flavin-dependent oxidoreductase [Metabacillus sediminilitoris]QGQ47979.1 MsnO8 family LLM class oxidoreductase [Metabacillus sediminilitoris]THF80907.1 LLM class flavin-dependent oxidoreductase [Metabacillus sediminilitoris]